MRSRKEVSTQDIIELFKTYSVNDLVLLAHGFRIIVTNGTAEGEIVSQRKLAYRDEETVQIQVGGSVERWPKTSITFVRATSRIKGVSFM